MAVYYQDINQRSDFTQVKKISSEKSLLLPKRSGLVHIFSLIFIQSFHS